MADKEQVQQPGPGETSEAAENKGTLEDVIDALDAAGQLAPQEQQVKPEIPGPEDGKPEGQADEAGDESGDGDDEGGEAAEESDGGTPDGDEGGDDGEEEGSEPSDEPDGDEQEKDKNIFSDEAYKIFKSRIGKEKAKRVKFEEEVARLREENDRLAKTQTPEMQAALASVGVDPEFIDSGQAGVIATADKLQRRLAWLREASRNPDGYEDGKGNSWSQSEITSHLTLLATDPDTITTLADARSIRTRAMERQKEVIREGLKVLQARERARNGIGKSKPAATGKSKPAPTATKPPPEPASTATAPEPSNADQGGFDRRKFSKAGSTMEALVEQF